MRGWPFGRFVLCLLFLTIGCADDNASPDVGQQGVLVAPLVSEDWIGFRVGASPGIWRYIADLEIAAPEDREYVEPRVDQFENGWPRRYFFSADTSEGHSGGPGYFTHEGGQHVFGVNIHQGCGVGGCTPPLVNGMRPLTPTAFDTMMMFMGL